MANRYVYSGATGTGSGADWTNAFTTLAAAISGGAAGDTYYVAHDHAESTAAALALTFKGTDASPDTIICVNRAGSVPPVAADIATTATVTTTGNTGITLNGRFYCYGISFQAGSGASGTASISCITSGNVSQRFEACSFKLLSTGTSSRIAPAATISGGRCYWHNCTVSFAAAAQGISQSSAAFVWTGAGADILAVGSSVPTTLIATLGYSPVTLSGLDLSQISGTIISGGTFSALLAGIRIINCRLHASATVSGALTAGLHQGSVEVIGSHSTTNAARAEKHMYQGVLTTENTIVRTGGANDGTTGYSWQIDPTASNERHFPFETFEGVIWNADTGVAKTLTVHTVTDGITLTDAEIWLEVEYLSSSSYPIASFVSDAPATPLTTAANQATSTETWTTTGLASPTKQKLEATFTPNMAGPVRWRVKYARTSGTVYVCPKAELS